ncbi:MAG: transglycosylase SLT domain-containing protein [Clostridia bacterium]|nr:transglycosylase SLT domain-containing protein [Clostridia bacterium]
MAKDKLPLSTEIAEGGVYEGDAYGKLELPVIIKRPSKQEENKNDVTVDVSRPGVGSSGATNEKVFVPYDVPLSIEQQKIVEKIAERFYISEELIFGVMKVESKYNVYAIGKNGNYLGIMQIAKSNLKILKQYCGVTDLMDFEQNVIAGSYYLRTYLTRYNDDKHISLLYYHGGYKYANKLIANGQYEDAYTRAVIKEMNRIVEARRKLANEMGVKLYGGFYEDYT